MPRFRIQAKLGLNPGHMCEFRYLNILSRVGLAPDEAGEGKVESEDHVMLRSRRVYLGDFGMPAPS